MVAGPAGVRYRRDQRGGPGQCGEFGRVHLPSLQPWRIGLSEATAVGAGVLWNPDGHRRGLRSDRGGGGALRQTAGRRPALTDGGAVGPRFRRRGPDRGDRQDSGAPGGAGQGQPEAAGDTTVPGRLVPVSDRPTTGPRGGVSDPRADHRRTGHDRVPPRHHTDRPPPVSGVRPGPALPRTLGGRDEPPMVLVKSGWSFILGLLEMVWVDWVGSSVGAGDSPGVGPAGGEAGRVRSGRR